MVTQAIRGHARLNVQESVDADRIFAAFDSFGPTPDQLQALVKLGRELEVTAVVYVVLGDFLDLPAELAFGFRVDTIDVVGATQERIVDLSGRGVWRSGTTESRVRPLRAMSDDERVKRVATTFAEGLAKTVEALGKR